MNYEEEIDLLRNEVFELRKGEDTRIVISELMARVDVQATDIERLHLIIDSCHEDLNCKSDKIDELDVCLDEAEKLIQKNADQINSLLAQVAALKEIAIKGVAQMLIAEGAEMCIVPDSVYSEADCYCVDDVMQCPARDYVLSEALRQLAEEHPEAFR